MNIEALSISDIDAVLKIESHSFRQPWERISFLSELACKYAICLVARQSDGMMAPSVIAYLCGRFIGERLYILKLAVSDQWRGLGVASKLLDESIRRAIEKGTVTVLLDVRLSNQSAIGLYRKNGFQTVGIRLGYYSDTGEDALVMEKGLKEEL